MTDPLQAVATVVDRIRAIFALMEIAEEEIKRAKLTKAQDSRAFLALRPSEILRGFSPDVYRAHARELCQRVKMGLPLDSATDAEVLCALSSTSLKAPLTRNASAAYDLLFARVMPGRSVAGEPATEAWPRAAQEEIYQARKRIQTGRT